MFSDHVLDLTTSVSAGRQRIDALATNLSFRSISMITVAKTGIEQLIQIQKTALKGLL